MKNIKKGLILCLVFSLSFSLFGCSKIEEIQTNTPQNEITYTKDITAENNENNEDNKTTDNIDSTQIDKEYYIIDGNGLTNTSSTTVANNTSETSQITTNIIEQNTQSEVAPAHIKHTFKEATCLTAKTCTECGYTEGKPITHTYKDASCTAASTCIVCNTHSGTALGHDWQAASCTSPRTCNRCNLSDKTALGHDWNEATCTTAKTCTRCKAVEGKALNHSWKEATCTTPKQCSICKITIGEASGHTGGTVTCSKQAVCTKCSKPYGPTLAHTWKNATCTEAKTCTVCKKTEGNALGHTGNNATCTTSATCTRCNTIYKNATGHTWQEATCKAPKTCSICKTTEGKALDHTLVKLTCSSIGTKCTKCDYINITGFIGEGHISYPYGKNIFQEEKEFADIITGVDIPDRNDEHIINEISERGFPEEGCRAFCPTYNCNTGGVCGECKRTIPTGLHIACSMKHMHPAVVGYVCTVPCRYCGLEADEPPKDSIIYDPLSPREPAPSLEFPTKTY